MATYKTTSAAEAVTNETMYYEANSAESALEQLRTDVAALVHAEPEFAPALFDVSSHWIELADDEADDEELFEQQLNDRLRSAGVDS